MSAKAERPRGVTVVAVLLIATGALLAAPGFALGASQFARGNWLGGLLTMLVPQALVVAGVGLLLLKRWAATLAVVAVLYMGFRGAEPALDAPTGPNLARAAVGIAVALALMWYLSRPRVKGALRSSA